MLSGYCPVSFGVLFCSLVLGSRYAPLLKLLDRVLSGARFLTVDVLECDTAHRQSVAVLGMLYKIKCNPMHTLNGALHGPVPVTRDALVVHRYTYASPRCRTSQYNRTFIVSFWNDLANPVFDGMGLAGVKSRANAFLLA